MSDDFIPAATILLLRDEPAFEVLMVERHENIRFAGGALVFPGGRIDVGDENPAWAEVCDGLSDVPEEERTARIAAIREAYEETGILFARDASGGFVDEATALALDPHRRAVEDDSTLFLPLIRDAGLQLAPDALQLFARWRPPNAERVPRRYDTWFYAARTPPGQTAREDGNEATEAIWISPAAAMAARNEGARKMIFPTARNVELIGVSGSSDDVIAFARERTIALVEPQVVDRDGELMLTIPDGLGYPVTEEPLSLSFRA